MRRKKQPEQQPEQEWTGVFAAKGAAAWVERELFMEQLDESDLAPAGAQPVSVRVEAETLALLDAFADRFNTSRSGVLLELISSGLGEAFRALPRGDQSVMAAAVRAKCPKAGGFEVLPKAREVPREEQA